MFWSHFGSFFGSFFAIFKPFFVSIFFFVGGGSFVLQACHPNALCFQDLEGCRKRIALHPLKGPCSTYLSASYLQSFFPLFCLLQREPTFAISFAKPFAV